MEMLVQKEEMRSRLPPLATSKSVTQEPRVRSENPGKQCHPEHWDAGQRGARESRMSCIPRGEPPSSSTPSTGPENSWGLGHCPAPCACSPSGTWPGASPLQGVHRADLNFCTSCRALLGNAEHSWENGAGLRLFCACKESPEGRAFASICTVFLLPDYRYQVTGQVRVAVSLEPCTMSR